MGRRAILGRIQNVFEAVDKLEIHKHAKLVGDIRTARIMIEDGAYFKGSIEIVKAEALHSGPELREAIVVAPSFGALRCIE